MKCVKKDGEVRRVHDHEALVLVEEKGWEYCPKSEFKEYQAAQKAAKEALRSLT